MKQIEYWILELSKVLPLELYVFLGAFIEEVIPPIPSPLILITAGTLANAQSQGHLVILYLLWLAVCGAVGKVMGAAILYILADKAEDIIVGKFGKFVGVSHKEIEMLGKRFKGGWKDDLLLFILRATPVIPSSLVSLMSGAIRLNWRTYIVQTFLGTVVRNMIFLYVGIVGYSVYARFEPMLDSAEKVVYVLVGLGVVGIGGYFIAKKYKDKLADKFINDSK